jgi:epoxyqueuosine reductase QueG
MKKKLSVLLEQFLSESNYNCLPGSLEKYYDAPLIRFADINDPLFAEYKTLIGDFHLTPKEAFREVYPEETIENGTVISMVFPISEYVRKSNRIKGQPSREWAWLRSYADEELLRQVSIAVTQYIENLGGKAVTPVLIPSFKKIRLPDGPVSNWSERHVAYVAGHGSFSLNDGFITERGIAVRFLSLVTDLVFEADTRTQKFHNENCLFCSKGTCGACIRRCPVGAITKEGHDKVKCAMFTYGDASRKLAVEYGGLSEYGAGCGLCQTAVPCEFKVP